jgi:hypothetical protein
VPDLKNPKSDAELGRKPPRTESPSRHYKKPHDVLKDESLPPERKEQGLQAWEKDAEALQRAEDEGMGGGEPTKLIDVKAAQKALARGEAGDPAKSGDASSDKRSRP